MDMDMIPQREGLNSICALEYAIILVQKQNLVCNPLALPFLVPPDIIQS